MELLKTTNNSLKMDKKIYLVFSIVVLIGVSNAIISAITIRNSKRIVYDISLVTNPTLEKLEEMNLLVTRSRMLITNWVYLPSNQTDKDSLVSLHAKAYPQLKISLKTLMSNWHKMENVDNMNRLFNDYEQLVVYEKKITQMLKNFDDYQDPMKKFAAEEQIENEIIPRSNAIMIQLRQLTEAKKKEAASMQNLMIKSYFYLLVMVLGLAVLIIFSVLLAGGYMLKKVIVPIMKIREVVLQMSKGELPDFNLKFSYNALGEMSYAIRQLIDGLKRTANFAGEIGKGNLNTAFQPLSKGDVFGSALLEMRTRLSVLAEADATRNWNNQGIATLGTILHKNTDSLQHICEELIAGLTTYIDGQQGAIYLLNTENENDKFIELTGYYGLNTRLINHQRVGLKEGLLGQAIFLNKSVYIPNISDPEYFIATGLTKSSSCYVLIVPLYASGHILGAIEIVSASEISETKINFIEHFAEPVASNLFSLKANLLTKKLLQESQKQTEELAAQDEELRQINDELTTQSQLLRLSEEELKSQQEELKKANTELETKAVLLEEKNRTIEDARQAIVFKAEQFEKSNKYKSAFLANMSHELRTPLNSVLILAKLLADNREKNLNSKQMEYATVIHKSGSDLLYLINDILDLSKIESGKIELTLDNTNPSQIISDLHQLFKEFAAEKGIHFKINIDDDLPELIFTDRMRLDQILKNMLSNAFKFTPKDGTVELKISTAKPDLIFKNQNLFAAKKIISIAVSDSGIGIPHDKQQLVFEAFKQADGSTSRKYGGTGLGLAISKELANLLGGDLVLDSEEGKGSTFTLHIPDKLQSEKNAEQIKESPGDQRSYPSVMKKISKPQEIIHHNQIFDDRDSLQSTDKRILIIEDDLAFCKTIIDMAHHHEIKVIAASQGDVGLQYAADFFPNAILLDMQLPVMDGWTLLKKLKEDRILKHIPVYVVSGMDKKKLGLEMGAADYFLKPVDTKDIEAIFLSVNSGSILAGKKVLLVENSENEMEKILNYLQNNENELSLFTVENLQECMHNMETEKFDRILVNSSFTGSSDNMKMIAAIDEKSKTSGSSLYLYDEEGDQFRLNLYNAPDAENNPVFLNADNSPLEADIPETQFKRPDTLLPELPGFLKGKKILLVDDDMRNIYALTSILEEEGIVVVCAYDGLDALEKLKQNDGIELVLMDIMMPEMNGYEATKEIRKMEKWKTLPVIALTAKAMSGDREKCMQAGASDYLSKPVNTDQLLSIMKVWLYQ